MTAPRVSPNRDILISATRKLGSLLDQLVFVGGQVAEILVTDPLATRVRPTDDVDVVTKAATRSQYAALSEKLRTLGFSEDTTPGAPICRWRTGDGVVLDVMPVSGDILGFTNQWYEAAVREAVPFQLAPGLTIRITSAPAFLAMKWAAFDSRGREDYLGSHDIEDIVTVTAGRSELPEEIAMADATMRVWLSERTSRFLGHRDADDAIAGALPDARMDPDLIVRVKTRFAAMATGK